MALLDSHQCFVDEMLVDGNATAAYVRAGFSPKSADRGAARLMARSDVQAALAEARKARSERTEITADMVLERWWQIATADPNEVVQFRRNACRYCHGIDHDYHWRDVGEHEQAKTKALKARLPEPDMGGGFGFDENREPHAGCPRCNGNGYGRAHIADTRRLKGAGKLLYAGVKEGRDGIEVKLQDQAKALENVARHLGVFKERVEHSGKIEVENLSDDELAAKIAAYERAGGSDGANS